MKARLFSQSGFGLVEVLVAASIMMTVLYGLTQMMANQYKSVRANRSATEYNQLISRIARYSGMGSVVARSAGRRPTGGPPDATVPTENEAYRFCLYALPPATLCTANTNIGFWLIDPAGVPVAGPATAPVLYDLNGAICAVAGPRCPYRAIVSYNATCPLGAATCTTPAQSIRINYTVEQIPGVLVDGAVIQRAATGGITTSIPLPGYVSSISGRLAFWNSTTELNAANMAQTADRRIEINPGGTEYNNATANFPVLFVNGTMVLGHQQGGVTSTTPGCHGFSIGAMRNNGGTIEVCDGATWRWATGPINSSQTVGFGPGAKFPRMPGLYVCPQNGRVGTCEIAGLGPVCQGQVSQFASCCQAGAMVACDPLD